MSLILVSPAYCCTKHYPKAQVKGAYNAAAIRESLQDRSLLSCHKIGAVKLVIRTTSNNVHQPLASSCCDVHMTQSAEGFSSSGLQAFSTLRRGYVWFFKLIGCLMAGWLLLGMFSWQPSTNTCLKRFAQVFHKARGLTSYPHGLQTLDSKSRTLSTSLK